MKLYIYMYVCIWLGKKNDFSKEHVLILRKNMFNIYILAPNYIVWKFLKEKVIL